MARRSRYQRPQRPLRTGRSGGSKTAGLWLFLLGILVGAGLLYLIFGGREVPPPPAPSSPHRQAHRQTAPEPKHRAGKEKPEPAPAPVAQAALPEPEPTARIALVIDDLGRSTDDLVPLEKLGVPITYSVLPFEENTPAVVSQLRSRREEILLHLPMEPKNGENPGPGALLKGMTDDQLRVHTLAALQAVPGAVGVNNHMGSSLSADTHSMSTVLRVLSSRGLFFLDSRTSPDSVGYRIAVSLGVPAAERQVFLDPDLRPETVHEQFQRLLDIARTRGAAVAIGHPHPDTLAALAEEVPRAKAEGFDFVPVSDLLDRSRGPQ
jgi:polysaccharide deacetylase 2 family uncharacterized protein YibQ